MRAAFGKPLARADLAPANDTDGGSRSPTPNRMTVRVPMSALAGGERDLDARAGAVRRARPSLAARATRSSRSTRSAPSRPTPSSSRETRVRLGEPRERAQPPRARSRGSTGARKGDKADAIVRDATELGATRIVFVQTARIVARPPASRVERWERIAREAARQCGRGDAPTIALVASWDAALDAARADTRVCLVPDGAPLRGVLERARGSLAFAVGPEGGLTDAEVAAAAARGFLSCRLGEFVMRTETVAAAALGAAALYA